jgi:hypothetical protein
VSSHNFVLKSSLRKIKLTVGETPVRKVRTFAYPISDGKTYEIPTYKITVSGKDNSKTPQSKEWECYRFGIYNNDGTASDHSARGLFVAGMADAQKYIIDKFNPSYSVHSARSTELGAWHVVGGFLIHDGPDDPVSQLYASIGCIEICGKPAGFDQFNNFILSLSGSKKTGVSGLVEIGNSGILEIEYKKAQRPPLKAI